MDTTARSTKYARLADWLREQIQGGALRPGDRLPSVGEMRTHHDASVATVDRALGILENDGLIVRVNGSGVFVADRREDPPVTANTRPLIGLILPNCQNSFFSQIIEAVEKEAGTAGYHLLIANSMGNPEREAMLLAQLVDQCVGLCIVPCGTGNQAAFAGLLERKRPFVLIDRRVEGLAVPLVTSDNERGGYLATQHLLEVGRRRIHVVGEALHRVSALRERVTGYRRALNEGGLTFDPALVHQADLLPDVAGYALTKELLRHEAPGSNFGIFALNEWTARGCYMALKEHHKKIPDEVSVVAFDDLHADLFDPPLTAIRQNLSAMGREAAARLFELIKAGGEWKTATTRIPSRLVIRSSSDPDSGFSTIENMLKSQPGLGDTIFAAALAKYR